jgi:HSP20 family protein
MNSNCCSTTNSANSSCGCATSESPATQTKTAAYLPSVDVHESPEAIVLTADVPGARPDGVDITFEENTLTLHATVAPRADQGHARRAVHREYGIGDYTRQFTITEPIDRDRIKAGLTNGVLTVTLPKAESARPRKIPVSAANN